MRLRIIMKNMQSIDRYSFSQNRFYGISYNLLQIKLRLPSNDPKIKQNVRGGVLRNLVGKWFFEQAFRPHYQTF